MSEIVKYHNDFNKIKLPSFNELEQNLLFGMLVKVKNNSKCEFTSNELREFISDKNPTNTELLNYAVKLRDNFFKANFTEIREINDKEREMITYNLFKRFKISYVENENKTKSLTHIELEINEIFAYLVNELTANFTAFELSEFITLSGKYTKTLYRLLKQYRTTGKAYFEWEEFRRVMDIAENKTLGDIDKFILKPALKELSKERNIFDQIRVPFKNLAYEKEKQKGTRGRGGKVIGITFTFKPENVEMQKLAKESEKIETKEDKYLRIAHNMVKNKARFVYENMLYEANSFDCKELKFIAVRLIRDEFENLIYDIGQTFNAKNKEAFFKMIDTFKNNIV
ncbi:replication initiation protein [Campylobacter upsaliensis]|nr:replication initiation protein [Campylobacter upsaliensis]